MTTTHGTTTAQATATATAATPANDNNRRPKSFDDRVMSYRPGLSNLAYKLGFSGEEKDDVVTDTIMVALHRWASFRGDGGFWNWLAFTMRACAQERRALARRRVDTVSDADGHLSFKLALSPPQGRYMELSDALRAMQGRDGAVLLRRAMGDELHVIGAEMGISRERVRQLEARAREKLVADMGVGGGGLEAA